MMFTVEKAGGHCLPCIVDIREDSQVEQAVQQAVDKFGGIDILVNNASAIHLTGTTETPMKRYVHVYTCLLFYMYTMYMYIIQCANTIYD